MVFMVFFGVFAPQAAFAQYYQQYYQPQYQQPSYQYQQQPSYYTAMPSMYASPYVTVNAYAGNGYGSPQYPSYYSQPDPYSYQYQYQPQQQYYQPQYQYQQQQQNSYRPSRSSASSYGPGPVGQPTGDTVWGNDMCYYPGYGRAFCGFDPTQKIYDPWTGTWY